MLEFQYDPATGKATMRLGKPGGKVVTRPVVPGKARPAPKPPPAAVAKPARKRRPRQ